MSRATRCVLFGHYASNKHSNSEATCHIMRVSLRNCRGGGGRHARQPFGFPSESVNGLPFAANGHTHDEPDPLQSLGCKVVSTLLFIRGLDWWGGDLPVNGKVSDPQPPKHQQPHPPNRGATHFSTSLGPNKHTCWQSYPPIMSVPPNQGFEIGSVWFPFTTANLAGSKRPNKVAITSVESIRVPQQRPSKQPPTSRDQRQGPWRLRR